jgi:hypothetical protein
MREACNFAEDRRCRRIVAFVKHESRDTEQRQFGGFRSRHIRALLKTIADINKCANFGVPRFDDRMAQYTAQLRRATAASDALHPLGKNRWRRRPFTRFEFATAAKETSCAASPPTPSATPNISV